MSFRLPIAFGLAAGSLLMTPSAFAFDCTKASTDVEKAICADQQLKAADDAMAASYTALLPSLTADQQTLAKANQRSWLKQRADYCSNSKGAELTKCLMDMTQARTTMLAGKAESGPGSPMPLKPFFASREQSKTKCAVDVVVLKFDPATGGAAGKVFNAAIDKMLADMEHDNGDRDPSVDPPYDCDYSVSGTLTFASYDLADEDLAYDMYGGGAHPMNGEISITVDLKNPKILTYADIYGTSAQTKKTLIDACTADLIKVKKARFADAKAQDPQGTNDYPDPAEDIKQYADAIAANVTDFGHWMIRGDHVDVYFAPYDVGSYAEGSYSCTLPNSLLNTLPGPNAG